MADGLVIAAPATGSGKTVVTTALAAAARAQGKKVATAKVGPDYIDPRFHAVASGKPCFNLDPWAMRPAFVSRLFEDLGAHADLVVVEGVMGLFDGPVGARGSTADVAAALGLPVVLVIDAGAQGQSVAALARGFSDFRHDVEVEGVILNRVTSPRHADMLSFALREANVAVFGAMPREASLVLPSRHLGLVQAEEHSDLEAFIKGAAEILARSVDLKRLLAITRKPKSAHGSTKPLPPLGQRIAVASDQAFAFAYPHFLAGWRAAGAELLPFSPLVDEAPDATADAVFLPGGYPELHGGALAAATRFKAGLAASAERGALLYGECGGFMVLGEGLVDASGARHAMAGLLPLETTFAERRLNLGYRRMTHAGALPLPATLRGHEFHYSGVARSGEAQPLFEQVQDARGDALGPQGLRRGRVMGSYLHVIDAEAA
ncbi:MAG: cobyrinate a,c-diamide synthase [Parvibaculaceae bacterium]